jgi:hypothetical protein
MKASFNTSQFSSLKKKDEDEPTKKLEAVLRVCK